MRIDAPAAALPARLPAIDAARGGALAAMVVYHAAWDLGFYDLIAVDIGASRPWSIFARMIAASFLALVGVSLVLSTRNGLRPRPFLRRLAVIAGAALAITVATRLLFPEDFIYFGILHCIAVSSVLALPFLRWPPWVAAAAAAGCLAAPALLAAPAFDAPAWRWLGLMTYFPRTNDYVPLLPWFGAVLAGLAAARLALPAAAGAAWTRWQPRGRPGRALVWAGRHSLAVYLVHQPLLLALLYGVAAVAGPSPAAETARFMEGCTGSCTATGMATPACTRYCGCMADALVEDGLWRPLLDDRLPPDGRMRVAAIAGSCRAAGTP